MLRKHESIFSALTLFNNNFGMILKHGRYITYIIWLVFKGKCTLKYKSIIVYYMFVQRYLIQIAGFSLRKMLHYFKISVNTKKILMQGRITIISYFVLCVQYMQVKSLNKPIYHEWAEPDCIRLYCHTNMIEKNPFKDDYSVHMPYQYKNGVSLYLYYEMNVWH